MTSTATSVQNAVAQIILGLNITPRTTLTAQATAGAQSLTVADASRFSPDGVVFFADTLGESIQTVSVASGTGIALDFTGVSPVGLQSTHTNGTTVYTNLMTEIPIQIGPMLAKGDPFIFVSTLDEMERRRTSGLGNSQKVYQVRVGYYRSVIQYDDAIMAENRWASLQQEKARADLDTISTAIRLNPSLGGAAVQLGDAGRGDRMMTRSWQKLTQSRDIAAFVANLDLTVTGAIA